ncbi:uncharacterized protein LOC107304604 [Oryza brachyantha]|uniref:Uncharacterized protein n=1 Tax=Oryza brachyantha TaxID=4533 RepID=J3MII8_ORYBR|nr:uncharacterized protein LOC107304604 [Oryza brachyantha]
MALRHLAGKLRLAAGLHGAVPPRAPPAAGRPRFLARSSQGVKNGRAIKRQSGEVQNGRGELEREILRDIERTIDSLPRIAALSMLGGAAGLAAVFYGGVFLVAAANK